MTHNTSHPPYNSTQIWILAIRPKTLPAAASPVIVGIATALAGDRFRFGPALAALLAALLLQIGANLANDVFDFHKGADNENRLGPLRVTQAGLLTPQQVLAGMWAVFGLAICLGTYLTVIAGWPVILIGVLSIVSAIAYTGGPFPLGYYGLGDLFVFLFFGPVAVIGAYYVQAGQVSNLALWASVPMGLLTTAILVVNNLRDVETDRAAGKHTLAVRFGPRGAQAEYLAVIAVAYSLPVVMWLVGVTSAWVLLAWLSLPLLWSLLKLILYQKGKALNQALAQTGQLELAFGLLFALGIVLGAG